MADDPIRAAMAGLSHEEQGAILRDIDPRVKAALASSPDDAELARLGRDFAIAAQYAIDSDSYGRPDDYMFGLRFSGDHVPAFLDLLFARFPETCTGVLEGLYGFHGRALAR